MATSTQSNPPSSSDLVYIARWLGRIFLAAALALSLYLGVLSLTNGAIAGCGEGGGCHQVLSSKWGYFFGIPVSLLGAAVYITLLASDFRACCPRVHAACRWLIVIAAVWFVGVQAFILGEFCPWCCVTHTLAVLGALFLWRRTPRLGDDLSQHKHVAPIFGLLAIGGLILAQSVGPDRPTTAGISLDEGQGTQVSEVEEAGPRTVTLHGGTFSIDVGELPSIGDAATAEHVAVGLFDFTCPHCRELTETLTGVQQEFGSQLAVVQLPGYFGEKGEAIHRLLLPIWKEEPETYHELARLLHEGTLSPEETDVRAAIGSMVDPAVHQRWINAHSVWTNQVLARSQAIREANRQVLNTGKFPQLMVGDYVEAGNKSNPGHYYQLFEEKFGLKRTAVPTLVVAPASISMGEVYVGTRNRFTLRLTNPGQVPVRLSRPELVPGMRLVTGFPKELAAGKTMEVQLEAIPPSPGDIKGEITILSDAENPAIKIPIEAKSKHVFQANPSYADLGFYEGEPLVGKVELTFPAPVTLGDPAPNNPGEFRAVLREVTPGTRYELEVTGEAASTRAGLHQTSITIPIRPANAGLKWPENIRVAARFQVRVNSTPGQAGRPTAPVRRLPPATPAAPPVRPPIPGAEQDLDDIPE